MRGFAERTAINTPLQGTAADLIKLAMLKIDQLIRDRKLRSQMTLQVHDELLSTSCQRRQKSFGSLSNERWSMLPSSQSQLSLMWELAKIGAISSNHLFISLICSTIPPCDLPLFSLCFLPSPLCPATYAAPLA